MTLNIGVIGTGVMGSDHARTIARRVAGARTAAVADLALDRATALAAELGARATDDAAALIAADDVDAVVIASHDATHEALTLACIEAGKPVLCEKPLAPTGEACRTVLAAERAAGRRLVSVGFTRRFDAANVELRDALRAGAIGAPLMVHAIHRNMTNDPTADSAVSITGTAIHELDELPWLLGSPLVEARWLAGRGTARFTSRRDPQLVLLRTADDVLVTLEVFVHAEYGYDVRVEVVGETGTLETRQERLVTRNTALSRATAYFEDSRPRYADAYRLELQAFVDGARTGEYADDLADATDGLRATLAAEAVLASMRSGDAEAVADDEGDLGRKGEDR